MRYHLVESSQPEERAFLYFVTPDFQAVARIRKSVIVGAVEGRTPETCPACQTRQHKAPEVSQ